MFAYDDAITERFPSIRAGVIHATGLSNGPSPPELLEEYRAEQRAAAERLEAAAIADLPQVAAWRRVFSEFGAKPTRYRNAAEALLRRLSKHGDVPTISALVEAGGGYRSAVGRLRGAECLRKKIKAKVRARTLATKRLPRKFPIRNAGSMRRASTKKRPTE